MILKYLFIFCIFSIIGWFLELIYRALKSKKIINPGFMNGCVVPLYGFGAVILDLLCNILCKMDFRYKTVAIFILGLILLSILELIAGVILLKIFKLRLWDYSSYDFNFKGYICLQYSLIWGFLTLIFYNFVFPYLDNIIKVLIYNRICLILFGVFVGIFSIDFYASVLLSNRVKKYSKNINQIINLEKLKLDLNKKVKEKKVLNMLFPYLITNKFFKDKNKNT